MDAVGEGRGRWRSMSDIVVSRPDLPFRVLFLIDDLNTHPQMVM
jgi:hypothetical protein